MPLSLEITPSLLLPASHTCGVQGALNMATAVWVPGRWPRCPPCSCHSPPSPSVPSSSAAGSWFFLFHAPEPVPGCPRSFAHPTPPGRSFPPCCRLLTSGLGVTAQVSQIPVALLSSSSYASQSELGSGSRPQSTEGLSRHRQASASCTVLQFPCL